MISKTILFTTIILCLFMLSSCKQPNDQIQSTASVESSETTKETTSWQKVISDSGTSQEDSNGNIYFSHAGGIWVYYSDTQDASCIIDQIYQPWTGFGIYDNNIYYFTAANTIVCSSLDNLSDVENILTREQLEAVLGYSLSDFDTWISEILNGDLLVIKDTGISCVA